MPTEEPAPRPAENNPLMAPQYVPPTEDFLQSGLGCIPGETPSEKVELVVNNLKAGLGCVPG